jgi:hypothetical protein
MADIKNAHLGVTNTKKSQFYQAQQLRQQIPAWVIHSTTQEIDEYLEQYIEDKKICDMMKELAYGLQVCALTTLWIFDHQTPYKEK